MHTYVGLARHLLLALQIFVGLGEVLKRWQRLLMAGMGLLGLLFLLLLHALATWVV